MSTIWVIKRSWLEEAGKETDHFNLREWPSEGENQEIWLFWGISQCNSALTRRWFEIFWEHFPIWHAFQMGWNHQPITCLWFLFGGKKKVKKVVIFFGSRSHSAIPAAKDIQLHVSESWKPELKIETRMDFHQCRSSRSTELFFFPVNECVFFPGKKARF